MSDDDPSYPSAESHKIAYEVGRLCIEWSRLEAAVGALLFQYLRPDSIIKSQILHGALDIRKKVELCKHLSFIEDPQSDFDALDTVLSFIDNEVRGVRNRYVHDLYIFNPERAFKTTYQTKIRKPQAGLAAIIEPVRDTNVSAEDIAIAVDDIRLCQAAVAFYVAIKISPLLRPERREEVARAARSQFAAGLEDLAPIMARYRRAKNEAASVSPSSSSDSSE